MKKFTSTIILILILAALGAFYFFYEKKQSSLDERKNTLKIINFTSTNNFNERDITAISIDFDTTKISLLYQDGLWKSGSDQLNKEKVQLFINNLYQLTFTERIPSISDEDSGISSSKLKIELASRSDNLAVIFGDKNPTQDSNYVKVGDTIYLVDSTKLINFQKNLADFK